MDTKPRQFCNNLRAGDRVWCVSRAAYGTVSRVPHERKRDTFVVFPGYERGKKVDVLDLRLDPDGKSEHEDGPPIDGEPPGVAAPVVAKIPHGIEEMRADIHRIVRNYPSCTVAETLGVLEFVKADMLEQLRRS